MDLSSAIQLIGSSIGAFYEIGAGLIGNFLAQGDEESARKLIAEAARMYGPEAIKLPEFEEFIDQTLDGTAYDNISVDPRYKEAQLASLDRLDQIGSSGGMLLEDKANLNRALGDANRQEQATRSRVLEGMRRRGTAGGGAEAQMLLAAQQGSANRAADAGLQTAATAQRRALDAILQRGRLAGDVRGQEFGEQARVADARDELARFNAAARERGMIARNQLQQLQYGNRLGLQDRRYGANRDYARYYQGQAQNTRDLWGGIGAGMNSMYGGASTAVGGMVGGKPKASPTSKPKAPMYPAPPPPPWDPYGGWA